MHPRLPLFPHTTRITPDPSPDAPPSLTIAGCHLAQLAQEHGTPLYVYDRATLDASVDLYHDALARHFPSQAGLTYAGKAFLCVAVAQWAASRGLWVDCTGEGELHIAHTAGVPRSQILMHGVNKSPADLRAALAQAGTLVVDNLDELDRVIDLVETTERGAICPDLWLRVRPGVAVETHAHTQTGQADSKFGMSRDEALTSVDLCLAHGLPLTGLHFHQGSHFHDPAPVAPALMTILDLAQDLRQATGWVPQVICPGGGWGVPYHEDDLPHLPVDDYVGLIAQELVDGCLDRDLPLPRLQLEPGRSLVAQSGVALYRVGAIKQTATRRWVLLDGGLADNPRPALYAARYTALPVADPLRPDAGPAWLAGPFCESGDILIRDLPLAPVAPGELVAVPMSGAYQLSMGSNYNGARKPAVLWLDQGRAQVIRRRESLADLVGRDVGLAGIKAGGIKAGGIRAGGIKAGE